jgi:RNAse (barnase) inhibitor barstar
MANEFIINGGNISDITTFYQEINRVFMQDENWKIGESLDAFNDMLYGGFGTIKTNEGTTLVWKDIEISRKALGYNATREYYLNKLLPDSPFNKEHFCNKLDELESGEGQTYFDIIIEIIAEHSNIKLVSE